MLLLLFAGSSSATAAGAIVGGSVAVTSDYVFRGISQTRNNPALQADLHVAPVANWTVGAWASQVQLLPASHSLELDYYTQWRWPAGSQFSLTLSAVYYTFPGDPRSVPYEYAEFSGDVTWRDRFTVSYSTAPKVTLFSLGYGRVFNRETRSLEVSARHRLPWRLDAHAGVGYFAAIGLPNSSYLYGSAGISRRFGAWRAELSYYGAQGNSYRTYAPGPVGGPLAATISWHF